MYIFHEKDKLKTIFVLLFFVFCVLCAGVIAHYCITSFAADAFCFSSEMKDNKIENILVKTIVHDDQDHALKADEDIKSILKTVAAQVEHSIWEVKIFEDKGEYFVAVKTNVNWFDPCDFYRYDVDSGTLQLLQSWDGVGVVSVARP